MQLILVISNNNIFRRLNASPAQIMAGSVASFRALAGPEIGPPNPPHAKPAHRSIVGNDVGDVSADRPPMRDRNPDLGQDIEFGHVHRPDSSLINSLIRIDRADNMEEKRAGGITTSPGDLKPPLSPGTIIHFWASWCRPCEEEFPQLEQFYRTHIVKELTAKGVRLITVSNDREIAPVARFIAKHGTTFPVYLDTEQTTNLAMVGKRTLPSTVMVGADGQFHRLALGKLDWDFPRLSEILAATAGRKPDARNRAEDAE